MSEQQQEKEIQSASTPQTSSSSTALEIPLRIPLVTKPTTTTTIPQHVEEKDPRPIKMTLDQFFLEGEVEGEDNGDSSNDDDSSDDSSSSSDDDNDLPPCKYDDDDGELDKEARAIKRRVTKYQKKLENKKRKLEFISAIDERHEKMKKSLKKNGEESIHKALVDALVDTNFIEDPNFIWSEQETYSGGIVEMDKPYEKIIMNMDVEEYHVPLFSGIPCPESIRDKIANIKDRIEAWNDEKESIEDEVAELGEEAWEYASTYVSRFMKKQNKNANIKRGMHKNRNANSTENGTVSKKTMNVDENSNAVSE